MKKQTLLIIALFSMFLAHNITASSACYMVSESVKFDSKTEVLSPDSMTFLRFGLVGGKPYFEAGYLKQGDNGKHEVLMLEQSPLGLITNIGDFSSNMKVLKTRVGERQIKYELSRSKKSQVDIKAKELFVQMVNAHKQRIEVEFVIENNNIAFRYNIPMHGETACLVVEKEMTGFNFPAHTTTFLSPQSSAQIGWKRTKPSYEEEYKADAPITSRSQYGFGYTFPCLFHEGEDGWVLVSETGLTGKYCGSRLSDASLEGVYIIEFPMEGENNGFGSTTAQMGLPGSTPWRTITLGETLHPIVETTIPFDVVKPLYEPMIDYKPGRASWSWIVWQDASMCYDDQKTFIDLAADMGWEYILMDALWDTQVGRTRMEELFKYAQNKGVDVFLWYNSNGGWNDAPQGMKHCMDNPISRKAEMKWLKEQGIKGLKVDFFGGDKQETIKLYEAILSDANDYGLQIIFHGCTLPRGWERMYPNYCASEAVLASENIVFQQHFCDEEAFNACLHPFIRNTVGSMDFGGTFLNKRMNRNNDGGTIRRTTDIFELATAVLFQSSVQNFALTPNNLKEQPNFEIDFMKQVPTTWDEVRFIDGYPGRYIVLARRSGADWYVAAINAEQEMKKITVELPMFAGKAVTYYHDGKNGSTPTMQEVKVSKNGKFKLTLQKNGGAILKGKVE